MPLKNKNKVYQLVWSAIKVRPYLVLSFLLTAILISFMESSIIFLIKPLVDLTQNPDILVKYNDLINLKLNYDMEYNTFIFLFFVFFSLLFIFIFFMNILSFFLASKSRELFHYEWKGKLIKSYLNKNITFFKNNDSGDLMQKLMVHPRDGSSFIYEASYILKESLIAMNIYFLLFFLSPKYTVYVTLLGIIIFCLTYFLGAKFVKKKTEKRNQFQSEAFSVANLIFKGIVTIKSFKKENYFKKIFLDINNKYKNTEIILNTSSSIPAALQKNLVFIIILLIIYLSLSQKVTFSEETLIISFFAGFYKINNSLGAINNAILSATRLYPSLVLISSEIDDLEKNQKILMENKKLIQFKNQISFENVFFKHKENLQNVIDGVNFVIKKNSSNLIVGPSGSGKSTFLEILAGQHNFEGKILIDGLLINSEDFDIQNISYLNQDSVLFLGSIKENIVFFEKDEDINNEILREIYHVCKLDELLEDMEKNRVQDIHVYNKLSLGQKQRVCLARALYSNKKIVILDEAISNVEKNLEKEIIINLLNFLQKYKKTSIIVSHSIANYIHVDNIAIMSDGKIIQNGKHEELIKYNNFYKDNIL
tara:strand:+ start:2065 stop:3846 length:1782 start_codon:yes stop_codon:yes gene_type:complete